MSVTLTDKDFPVLKNDLILRAARCQEVERIPVWVMRQAGRYLPEFREFRQKHDFFTICRTPELACEVTLQPIRRFDLDAAIIFSDILVIPQALGLEVEMKPSVGPVLPQPLVEPSDLSRLDGSDIVSKLGYVGEAITLTRKRLDGKVPLIGFAGAPWTIMSYMIEGGGSKTMSNAKKWLYKYPEASEKLLKIITDATIDYLEMQVKSGAQLLQVFESNCEYLSPALFKKFAAPALERISTVLKQRISDAGLPSIPLILFCKGGFFCLNDQMHLGYNVLGCDWTVDPELVRYITDKNIALQGNLDPVALQAPADELTRLTKKMVGSFGKVGYIANLGHGIYPDAPPESVETFVNAIHDC